MGTSTASESLNFFITVIHDLSLKQFIFLKHVITFYVVLVD